MTNEVLQWAALVTLALLILGVMRQVSLLLPPQLRTSGSGPRVGHPFPRAALVEVRRVANATAGTPIVVAFVTEGCSGCERLLGIAETESLGDLVLVVHQPSVAFRRQIEAAGLRAVFDDGAIWASCHVEQTPLALVIDGRGSVIRKEVTHRVDLVVAEAA